MTDAAHRDDASAMNTDALGEERSRLDDECLAANSSARVLISATSASAVEAIAYRIHQRSARADSPFVSIEADDLPADDQRMREECARLFAAADSGSVLVNNVERLSPGAQREFLARLERQAVSERRDDARLFTGTTASLFDYVSSGSFSEQLFYRINVVHLLRGS